MRRVLLVLLIYLLYSSTYVTRAQSCPAEAEPNDTVAERGSFAGCTTGQLAPGDQDLYALDITQEASSNAFIFALEGLPQTLTRAELFLFGADGTTTQSLFSFQTPDGSPTSTVPLLLAPGAYMLGFSAAGGNGSYTASVLPSGPEATLNEVEPNDARETATPVAGLFALKGELGPESDWFVWSVPEGSPSSRWHLEAQTTIGTTLELWLHNDSYQLFGGSTPDEYGIASLLDLGLPAGQYYVRLVSRTPDAVRYTLRTWTEEVPADNYESEPNGLAAEAENWSLLAPVHGRVSSTGDTDQYRIVIDADHTSQMMEVMLESNSRQPRRLCMQDSNMALPPHCREGSGLIALADLVLPPGEYFVSIAGQADREEPYTLTTRYTGFSTLDTEAEPNDIYQRAMPLGGGYRVEGRFDANERDVYLLQAAGEPQLWRVIAVGDGVQQLSYINAAGQWLQTVPAETRNRVQLSNIYLLPGRHYFEVRGSSGTYRLVAVPLGPPPPGLEREPNNAPGQSNALHFDQKRIGLLTEPGDEDYFRFPLAGEEHIRLTITPPEDGAIRAWIRRDSMSFGGSTNALPGEPITYETNLQPGDYELRLSALSEMDSPYTIDLTRENPFVQVTDREPNDILAFAAPIPASLHIIGEAGTTNDSDWYVLPHIAENAELNISSGSRIDLAVLDANSTLQTTFNWDSSGQVFSGILDATALQPFYLRINGITPYDLHLKSGALPQPSAAPPAEFTIDYTIGQEPVAAHWYIGQVVESTLSISNQGSSPLNLYIEAHTSHDKLTVDLAQQQIMIAPGEHLTLPVTVIITDDLPIGDYPITLRATAETGAWVSAAARLTASADAVPSNQQVVWRVPEAMLGGLNVAALSLGAEIVTQDAALASAQRVLHDSYTVLQDGFNVDARGLPLALTVRLASSDPVPVSGILLNTQSRGESVQKLQDFELWLSTDGQNFSKVLSDRLSGLPIEQAFVLPEPVMAHYARLVMLSNRMGNQGYIQLGEWKVIASPEAAPPAPFNLADPHLGGHIVYSSPQASQPTDMAGMLRPDGQAYTFIQEAGQEAEWVFGFNQNRTALITTLEWVAPTGGQPTADELSVWTSLEGPAGPWTSHGTWTLAQGAFGLPQAEWARFVRLAVPATDQDITRTAPDVIRVWEAASNHTYRSIVGEWGQYSPAAAYEWLHVIGSAQDTTGTDAANTRQEATLLQPLQTISDQVQIGQDEDWFRVDVPPDRNGVTLHITGDPTVRVRATFEDANGNPLITTVDRTVPGEQTITAMTEPGSTVLFKLDEPPRSIVFLWDNSDSVSAFADTIYNSLDAFAQSVTPGREVANFMPIGGDLLLDTWSDQPALLQQALTNYSRGDRSSYVEEALLTATNALSQREGTQGVVLITDAVSGSYNLTAELWRALTAARPRVFALHISLQISIGDLPASEQSMMQDWASANHGHYDFLRGQADLEIAFDRASVWLRRPVSYTFSVDVSNLAPPEPGTLRVTSSPGGRDLLAESLRNTTVEIILDASGSMTEVLGGQPRISIAKQVLLSVIDNILPEGTPFALRVFGNREGDYSCRTDLEVPLQPLDRAMVQGIVAGISPQVNANTAIAQSLIMVPEDLAGASGDRLVILLTDGEETCDGDPEAAIAALREMGINARINIVGLAINNPALETQFQQWALLGGGTYFGASTTEELSVSLLAALGIPYHVLNNAGEVVAAGTMDGNPIEVAAGVYTVTVQANPPILFEHVTVGSAANVELAVEPN